MISTAKISHTEYPVLTTDQLVDRPQTGSVISGSELDFLTMENALFKKISPFYYKDRVRVTLLVNDQFRRDYVLLKGIIEFHRTRNLVFTYDLEHRSLSIDINKADLDELRNFLSLAGKLLVKEKQFRHALRVAVEFEKRYRLEAESVYAVLRNTVQ